VVSIVDRFLEHSRIYYFQNGGDEEFYCSSADWMPRNLDKRVELLFPVLSETGSKKLRDVFEFFFSDNVKSRVLQSDGTYQFKKRKKNEEIIRCQEAIYQNMIEQKEAPQPFAFVPETSPRS
jgi:polyphosphate kinase